MNVEEFLNSLDRDSVFIKAKHLKALFGEEFKLDDPFPDHETIFHIYKNTLVLWPTKYEMRSFKDIFFSKKIDVISKQIIQILKESGRM